MKRLNWLNQCYLRENYERDSEIIGDNNLLGDLDIFRYGTVLLFQFMLKILVTGGAGFIGSHIAERCVKDGHEVHIIDDFSTGRMSNVIDFFGKVEVFSEDVRTFEPKEKYDVIFHVAARASIPESIKNPVLSNDYNVGGILRVLEIARETGAIVIFSSSSSVGQTPITPYALQKRIGEDYMRLYSEFYSVRGVALRYFNVFGERQETANGGYCLVLSRFLDQKKNGKPFTIYGTGEQRRDFIYVGDVVEASLKAFEYIKDVTFHDGFGFEIFNIGSGENVSVNELADLIDKKHPREKLSPRVEPFEMLADIRRTKKELGWSPQVPLKEWLSHQL